jgi:hypothetical protein
MKLTNRGINPAFLFSFQNQNRVFLIDLSFTKLKNEKDERATSLQRQEND